MALAHLWSAGIDWDPDLPPVGELCAEDRGVLRIQLERRINSPLTSSMGRLFDAASALIGVRARATYEGQAAIELEALCDPQETGYYPLALQGDIIAPQPLWLALLADLQAGVEIPTLAARFHNSIVRLVVECCQTIRKESEGSAPVNTVALSGGVWQNRFLLERVVPALEKEGFRVLIHRQVPANDGCIALGQIMVATSQEKIAR
jgi:hydrogenase maturation protein HypF